jgi:hypothetical protein
MLSLAEHEFDRSGNHDSYNTCRAQSALVFMAWRSTPLGKLSSVSVAEKRPRELCANLLRRYVQINSSGAGGRHGSSSNVEASPLLRSLPLGRLRGFPEIRQRPCINGARPKKLVAVVLLHGMSNPSRNAAEAQCNAIFSFETKLAS